MLQENTPGKKTAKIQKVPKWTSKNPDEEYKSRHAITIRKPQSEVYQFWRHFQNLPLFMKDVKEVQPLSETRSHWVVEFKNGVKSEWDAEVIQDIPNDLIAWKSVAGSSLESAGHVKFESAPANQGTVVSLAMNYTLPGGKLAEFALQFSGEKPEHLIMTNLKRLKSYMETGEYPTVQGQPSGRENENDNDRTH